MADLRLGQPIRVATHGPTVAWAAIPDDVPDYDEHDGRRVEWSGDYDVAPVITHIGYECETCGYDGQPWLYAGTVHPLPGETVPTTREKRTRSGRHYTAPGPNVPAWPHLRLLAYRCPACDDITYYDSHTDELFRLEDNRV